MRQLACVMKNESAIGTSRRRDRPEIDVGEQLSYLVEQGFRTKDTSTMFGCSSRTIQRRMKKHELSHLNFMSVSDAHLDSLVKEITYLFPKCGEKTVNRRLRSCNVRVPCCNVRVPCQRIRGELTLLVYVKGVEVSYIVGGIKWHHPVHSGSWMVTTN